MLASNAILWDDDYDRSTCIMIRKSETGGFVKWLCNYGIDDEYKVAKYAFSPNEASFWIVANQNSNPGQQTICLYIFSTGMNTCKRITGSNYVSLKSEFGELVVFDNKIVLQSVTNLYGTNGNLFAMIIPMSTTLIDTNPATLFQLDSGTDHPTFSDGTNTMYTSSGFRKLDNETFFMGTILTKSGTKYLLGFLMNVENEANHLFTVNKNLNQLYNIIYEEYSQRVWFVPYHPNDEYALILEYNSATTRMSYFKELLVNDDNGIYLNSYQFSKQSQLWFF